MRVLSAIINDIQTDQRVLKQADVLKNIGCSVTIACRRRSKPLPDNDCGFKIVKFRFIINKGPLFYLSYNIRLFLYLLIRKYDLYVANDLDTLLPCYLLSRLRRKPLVYDAHEYFTEQYGLKERKFSYNTWKRIEAHIVPKLKYLITVSDSIADLYYSEYGIKAVVVRNIAVSADDILPVSKASLRIAGEDLLVVLQGAGIHQGRGAGELLDAIKITSNVHLLIIGSGDAMDEIISKADDKSLAGKISFIPRMPWREMMSYTKACDAGLSLDKDLSVNQRFSLPNKLFDYISAGIPVISSSLPEVVKIVSEYDCGIIIKEVTPSDIADALVKLRDDSSLRKKLKKAALKASVDLVWDNEMKKESDLFKKIIKEYGC